MGVLVALSFTAATAYAWYSANARVNVNPRRVSATVYNNLNRPIACRGRVVGQLSSGQTLWSDARGVIYPGRSAHVYVYTNDPYNQFVNGWSNIQCQMR